MRIFIIFLAIFFSPLAPLFASQTDSAIANASLYGALTLLPPAVAIVLAFATKEVILSLFIGVFVGCFMLTLSSGVLLADAPASLAVWADVVLGAFKGVCSQLIGAITDSDDAGVVLQVLCIGGVVALITKMGGVNAVAIALTRFIKGPVSAQVNTWLVGLCIFFDDYANSLTVGPIMRPIADKFRISREKLSFILDSTAAPVAGIAIISTWIGVEVALIRTSYSVMGIKDINAFGIFLETIPYRFYNIFMLAFVVLTAVMQREFGPMWQAELNARRGIISEAALDVGAELERELAPREGVHHSVSDALTPILTLIISALCCFYFSGLGALEPEELADLEAAGYLSLYALRATFGNADSAVALFQAALFASVVAVILGLIRRKFTHREAIETWLHGWKSMIFTICMLLFAWSLTGTVKALGTPEYIVSLLGQSTPQVLLPSVIFLFGSMMSFAIGTSFGTMSILMPLAIPLAYSVGEHAGLAGAELHHYMVINISCVLTGAIFGNHCSPIADCVILSATSAKCELSAHVKTQLPYALLVCAVSLVFGYIPVSLGLNVYATIVLGIAVLALLLRMVGRRVEC